MSVLGVYKPLNIEVDHGDGFICTQPMELAT